MLNIINCNSQITVSTYARIADNLLSRLMGLMLKKDFDRYDALVLSPCKAIHTFFMRFTIDIVFLDNSFRVVYIKEKLKPWRFSKYVPNANMVIELPEGTIKGKDIAIGDTLKISRN
jgi:uncharacterized membrane protein (UPF0127 family)